jgi:hypothetical protein
MRWFNLVGLGMLTLGIYLDAWVYLYVWERFYIVVALGLSLWGGPSGK